MALSVASLTISGGCAERNTAHSASSEATQITLRTPSLDEYLTDDVRLQARAAAIQIDVTGLDVHREVQELLCDVVALLHYRSDLSAQQIELLRDNLLAVRERCVDPYERSLLELYLLLPEAPAFYGMKYAPDAEQLVYLSDNASLLDLVPSRQYRADTLALRAAALQYLARMPQRKEHNPTSLESTFVPSPFFEAVFAREGAPAAVETHARAALATIMVEMKRTLEELAAAHGGRLDPVLMFTELHRYLKSERGVTDGVQASVVAGLATNVFDCDVYTHLLVELGRHMGLPIEAIYLLDPSQPKGIGHCMPAAVIRQGGRERYIAFEMREPIEQLPDGSERRLYHNYDEMVARINRLAGEEVLSRATLVLRLTDEGKIKLLHPYGTFQPVELTRGEIKILHRFEALTAP